jgi:hypothetical protein
MLFFYCNIFLEDSDVTIDPTKVTPQQLCELGGEKISMPLSAKCQKKGQLKKFDNFKYILYEISPGLSIESNGDKLPTKDFTIERKILSFTSPSKKQGTNELHLVVKRKEYVEDKSTQKEFELYEDFLPYVTHGENKLTKFIVNILMYGFSFRSM